MEDLYWYISVPKQKEKDQRREYLFLAYIITFSFLNPALLLQFASYLGAGW